MELGILHKVFMLYALEVNLNVVIMFDDYMFLTKGEPYSNCVPYPCT